MRKRSWSCRESAAFYLGSLILIDLLRYLNACRPANTPPPQLHNVCSNCHSATGLLPVQSCRGSLMSMIAPPELRSESVAVSSVPRGTLGDYIAIARPDHWFKNVFMLAGVLLAYFYHFTSLQAVPWIPLVVALIATCLAAS